MVNEKSCGAVIFTRQENKLLFLIEKMQKGHFSLCKGHVESGETEHETARREIMEETALQVEFLDGFRETISYSPYPGCMKEVVFFLACATDLRTTAQESEVADIFWLNYEDALRTLSYPSDRDVLTAANRYLFSNT